MVVLLIISCFISVVAIIISIVSLYASHKTDKLNLSLRKEIKKLSDKHSAITNRLESLETMASEAKQDIERNRQKLLEIIKKDEKDDLEPIS